MDNFILGTIELMGAPSSSPDYIYVHAYLHVNKFLTTRYIYNLSYCFKYDYYIHISTYKSFIRLV